MEVQMTTTIELTDYNKHLTSLDSSNFLGYLMWWSVSDSLVGHAQFLEAATELGLEGFVPGPSSAPDAFRGSFENGQRRSIPTDDPDVRINVLVRQVVATSNEILKRVVLEEVGAHEERLSYREAYEVRFVKDDPDHLQWRSLGSLDGAHANEVRALVHSLAAQYQARRLSLNGQVVRHMIRRLLDDVFAVCVRDGGGVYFVGTDYNARLEALEALAARFPGSISVHSLPLLDDRKQRDMLRTAFEDEANKDVERIIAETTRILAEGKTGKTIGKRKFTTLQAQYLQLREKVGAYNDLLESQQNTASMRLEVLGAQLASLIANVSA